MTVARELVRRVRGLTDVNLPSEVAACARLHLLDAVGVGLAAFGSDVGAPYRRYAAQIAHGGDASIFGIARTANPADAALVNGGLIHSLEYDDTHTASIVHGSAVLAPAALAAAQAAGCSGARLLHLYTLGWELLVRMGQASPGSFQARGFQITSVGGALVSALIAAELWELSEDQAVAAIGISLSTASGVFEFLTNGASVKSLHPGWAAHAGLTAANLARAGMTGPETAIEGRFGLFQAFAGDIGGASAFASSLSDLGSVWKITEAAFKFVPCCHYLHPFVEAAGEIASRLDPGQIDHILCSVPAGAAAIICEPWAIKQAPPTGHAGRWSLPIVVATRLVEGRVDLETFAKPASRSVLDLAARIDWQPLENANFPTAFEAELVVRLRDGTHHSARIDDVYGNVGRPASATEIKAKFRSNAVLAMSVTSAEALEAAIEAIATEPDCRALASSLSPEPTI